MRIPRWLQAFTLLIVISLGITLLMLRAVDLTFSAVIIVSTVLLTVMALSFVLAFGVAIWMNHPNYATRRQSKLAENLTRSRREVAELDKEVQQYKRKVGELETKLQQLRENQIKDSVRKIPVKLAPQHAPPPAAPTQPVYTYTDTQPAKPVYQEPERPQKMPPQYAPLRHRPPARDGW